MKIVVKSNNKIQGSFNSSILPRRDDKIKLRDGKIFEVEDIVFVESKQVVTDFDYIQHIELICEKIGGQTNDID